MKFLSTSKKDFISIYFVFDFSIHISATCFCIFLFPKPTENLHVYLYFSVESFIFVSKNQWKKQQQGTMENYQVYMFLCTKPSFWCLKITVIMLYSYTCIKMCNRFSALIEGLCKLDPLNIHASSSFKI